ncbi:MAG: flagellar export protein FliJ [Lachnospiraceae bacterium]|nr:flagellar export protein FliJ [Lachnospiraceae bacterium]
MPKFKYRLQGVLDIKKQFESQARMEFAVAAGKLREQEEILERLKERREACLQEARDLRNSSVTARELRDSDTAIKIMDDRIRDQMLNVKRAEDEVSRARQKVQDLMMERKTYEKLREKAFREWMKEEEASEHRQVDELTSYTHSRDGQ